jgi:hypothetical protein
MSKKERSELNGKLESTEDKDDSPEVNVSVMPNLQAKLPMQLQMNSHHQKK